MWIAQSSSHWRGAPVDGGLPMDAPWRVEPPSARITPTGWDGSTDRTAAAGTPWQGAIQGMAIAAESIWQVIPLAGDPTQCRWLAHISTTLSSRVMPWERRNRQAGTQSRAVHRVRSMRGIERQSPWRDRKPTTHQIAVIAYRVRPTAAPTTQTPWGGVVWQLITALSGGYTAELPDQPATTPTGRLIRFFNMVTLTLLPSGESIPLLSARVGLDRDSVAWSIALDLAASVSLDQIRPTITGPTELALTINGYSWHLLAESVDESRAHGSRSIRVSGRGLIAELGAPYRAARSWVNDSSANGQQLIDRELPFGWTSSSWALELVATDWTVPAGTWSYSDQTPLAVIREVAGAVGARIDPDPVQRSFTIAPRYPIMPWEWMSAAADRQLDTDSILSLSDRWAGGVAYDSVTAHGATGGGVIGLVRRTGSAGTAPLPAISHPLLTTAQAVRERGRQALAAAAGPVIEVTATLPLAPVGSRPALLSVGELVEVADQSETWRGMVTAISVNASSGAVRQSVTIERRS